MIILLKVLLFPKIQELNSKLLIKCLAYDAKGKAKDLKSEIFTCGKSTIKSVKEEVFKRFYKPVYLLLLSMIACLLFFISKENKRFTLYKYIIFFIGIATIILSELSLRYASNNTIAFYFFISFPLFSILSLYIFSFYQIKNKFLMIKTFEFYLSHPFFKKNFKYFFNFFCVNFYT